MATEELEMVVVHTNQGLTVQWNPLTTKLQTVEIEEGNFMTHFRPLDEQLGNPAAGGAEDGSH